MFTNVKDGTMLKLILVLLITSTTFAGITPFKKCKLSNSQCMINEAIGVYNNILSSPEKYKLPSYKNFSITTAKIEGNGLTLEYNSLNLTGLDTIEFKDINIDLEKRLLSFRIFQHNGFLVGPYHLRGKFGPLIIDGTGESTISVLNTLFKVDVHYELFQKNGREYAKIVKSTTDYITEKITFDFGNIVSGNEELSKAANDALSKEWVLVNEALGAGVKKVINVAFTLPLVRIFETVPFNEIVEI